MREDWIECKLEDLLDYEQPTKYIIKEEKYNDEFPTPVLTAGKSFIKGYTNEAFGIFDNLPTIIFDDFTTASQFVNFKFKVKSSAMKILVPTSKLVNLKFAFGAMQVNKVRSETHKRYWISEYSKLSIGLPPLVEQRAIVKKLESLFSSLDAGIADLKKAQQQLKIYRQAVLKKAFEGELTKTIKKVEVVKLGSIIEKPKYGTSKKCTTEPIGKAVLRIPNINVGKINSEELKYAEFEDAEISALSLREGDILTIRSNGSVDIVGRCALVSKKDTDFLYAGYLIRLRPNLEKANPKYLVHCLSSHNLRVQIEFKAKSTSGVNNINAGELESLEIPLFSLEEQNEIVKQIESRLSVCDSIEQNIKESLEKAAALRQSILKKAFEGNLLTAQELAECKQAADYEPASVLLDRIKAEQNKVTAKPSKKKVAQPKVVAKVETPVVKVSADIHAGLIAKVIKIHEENPTSIDNLSHIKCEKIAHLVEYHLQIPLGRQPVKDAAGPDDYPHLKKIESRAKKAGFFNIVKKPIGYSYSSAHNSNKVIDKFQATLSDDKNKQLDDLIALFLKFDLEVSEIIATTYAGWNNLILNGNTNPSDEEIVYESRENWSERKLKIARERFFKAIDWMRNNEIKPTGYGAVVPFPKKKN